MKKIKKIFKVISKMLYTLLVTSVILLCIFAVVQKSTDNRGSIGGIKIFTVITGSMIPVYDIGEILIVKEVPPEEIKVGDDIVYKGEKAQFRNKTITHRVVIISQKEDGNYDIVTKGVANTAQDPVINQNQVLGKVIGNISIVSFALKIITNIYVWMFIPVVILVKKNIKRIINIKAEKE